MFTNKLYQPVLHTAARLAVAAAKAGDLDGLKLAHDALSLAGRIAATDGNIAELAGSYTRFQLHQRFNALFRKRNPHMYRPGVFRRDATGVIEASLWDAYSPELMGDFVLGSGPINSAISDVTWTIMGNRLGISGDSHGEYWMFALRWGGNWHVYRSSDSGRTIYVAQLFCGAAPNEYVIEPRDWGDALGLDGGNATLLRDVASAYKAARTFFDEDRPACFFESPGGWWDGEKFLAECPDALPQAETPEPLSETDGLWSDALSAFDFSDDAE